MNIRIHPATANRAENLPSMSMGAWSAHPYTEGGNTIM